LFYYRVLLRKVGKKTIFKFGSYCQYRETEIGNNCLIGFYNALGLVKIGDDVLIGGYVNFTSGLKQHSFTDETKLIREQYGERTMISIGNDCWIGNNSVICADLGDRVVVGAGSVVIKELPDYGVYVGSPAKLIKKLG
jgi:acetyltransferase-like isoleucine patch superfamily enzyme